MMGAWKHTSSCLLLAAVGVTEVVNPQWGLKRYGLTTVKLFPKVTEVVNPQWGLKRATCARSDSLGKIVTEVVNPQWGLKHVVKNLFRYKGVYGYRGS